MFKLIDKFNNTVKSENNAFICEEIVENLFILITQGKEALKKIDECESIKEFIIKGKSLSGS